jgi:hypothetical protein
MIIGLTLSHTHRATIPEFSKLSSEYGKCTHEHIGQSLAQLGELVDREVKVI